MGGFRPIEKVSFKFGVEVRRVMQSESGDGDDGGGDDDILV